MQYSLHYRRILSAQGGIHQGGQNEKPEIDAFNSDHAAAPFSDSIRIRWWRNRKEGASPKANSVACRPSDSHPRIEGFLGEIQAEL
jgi:hypothetical protein